MNSKPLRVAVLSLLAIVIISGLLLFYFKGISPTQKQVDQFKTKIASDKLVLAALQESVQQQELHKVDTLELQRMVPLDDYIDQLIQDFKTQETLSNSLITEIQLTYSETTLSETLQQVTGATEGEANNTEANAADGNVPVNPQVNSVNLNMTFKSPTYENLRKFINGIESLERVVRADSLEFSRRGESKDEYNLSLTVYYAPQFKGLDLKELLPKPIFPGPSGKKNPFNVRVPTIPTEQ
ncbi:hypothetical protein AMS62_06770 [Bacillus sp. FJAT-18019]|nr:hypothetical protein AMS62_06770 [Bacillus sp. FJAT-18019]